MGKKGLMGVASRTISGQCGVVVVLRSEYTAKDAKLGRQILGIRSSATRCQGDAGGFVFDIYANAT